MPPLFPTPGCEQFPAPPDSPAEVHVCTWSALVGPACLAVWGGPERLPTTDIARHTLLGEMGGVTFNAAEQRARVAYKVSVLPAPPLLVCSAVVCATRPAPPEGRGPCEPGTTMYSLSLVAPAGLLPKVQPLAGALQDRVQALGRLLHAALGATPHLPPALAALREEVARFLEHFAGWARLPPPAPLAIGDTLLGRPHLTEAEKVSLGKALTAFLQMHGTAVLRGDSLPQLQLWCRTLLLFLPPEDRHLARVPTDLEAPFVPELRVQGLHAHGADPAGELIYARRVAAVVHLGRPAVHVGLPLPIYTCLRQNYFAALLDHVDHRQTAPPAPGDMLKLSPQQAVAPLVAALLDLCLRSPVPLREGVIRNWGRAVAVLAQEVVSFVTDFEADRGCDALGDPAGPPSPSARSEAAVAMQRELWEGLYLTHSEDQRLVLAVAEGLHPGVTVRVLGPWAMDGALANILLGLHAF